MKGGEYQMKRGVILYITGNIPNTWNEDISGLLEEMDDDVDKVEVVLSAFESYDIHYAWWKLLMNGIQRISCRLAVFEDTRTLRLTGKELRLCG